MGGMGEHFQRNSVKKTRDTVIRLEIPLNDIFKGISKEIKLERNIEGKKEEVKMKINIPAGCQDGIKMVKQGSGDKQDDHEPGDVIIVISHEEHPLFRLSENHIVLEKKISFGDSLIGVKFSIDHISGETITINSNGIIEDGDLRVIKGKGFPHMKNQQMGDFVIRYNVEKNFILTEDKKTLLKEIFPVTEFNVDPKGTDYTAIDPKNIEQEDDEDDEDERGGGQGNMQQCAQQ
jgi:DnaJ-class molecular chaperone